MDLIDLINSRRFLGGEFLLWLWFKSECYEGLLVAGEHGGIEVYFDDALTLEAYLAETERNDFKGGSPAYSPEARLALRQGKRPARAKLGVIKEGREWSMVFKSESMDLSGLKIPALLSREEEEQFYERMFLAEELENIMRTLYKEFLTLRLHEQAWDQAIIPSLQAWIASDDIASPEQYPTQALESFGIFFDAVSAPTPEASAGAAG